MLRSSSVCGELLLIAYAFPDAQMCDPPIPDSLALPAMFVPCLTDNVTLLYSHCYSQGFDNQHIALHKRGMGKHTTLQ